MTGPTLYTERLVLRPPLLADVEPFAAFAADEQVMRHLGGVVSPHVAWRMVMTLAGSWALEGFAMFCVVERSTNRWIGRLGPWRPAGWPGTEIGWGLAREAWGKGYATEGAAVAIDWAFDTLGWSEVVHVIAHDNEPSQRVAERLGSRPLGPTRLPAPFDRDELVLWGQSRDAWRARAR